MSRFHLFVVVLVVLTGCSKNGTPVSGTPVVILASNGDGRPVFAYEGPGMYSYNGNFGSFKFQVGPLSEKPFVMGKPWVTGNGEMKFGESNDMVVSIQSDSDRAYDLRFLGVFTNSNLNTPEEKTVETMHVPAGKQSLKLERFVIYTYKK